MKRDARAPTEGLPGRARRLASGVASFFRQLSLFDPPETQPPKAVASAPAALKATSFRTAIRSTPASSAAEPDVGFTQLLRGPYARIEIEIKPRLHESWRVTWIRKREALKLEIPSLLAEAPTEAKAALLEWALLASTRPRRGRGDPGQRARKLELENLIRGHLHVSAASLASPASARRSARDQRKLGRLRPQGDHHDLDAILRTVNERYFAGTLQARVTWAARLGGLSTHTIARDGDGQPYHLLTISRGYDVPEATAEIVGGVVYHECLHIAIPPRREGGRRVVHGPDFRKREREYEHFAVWRKWHREGLPPALRRLQRQARRR
jgi:hypothetical protein